MSQKETEKKHTLSIFKKLNLKILPNNFKATDIFSPAKDHLILQMFVRAASETVFIDNIFNITKLMCR